MDKEYEALLNFYKLKHSKQYFRVIRTIVNVMPLPKKLSNEWIMEYLTSYENKIKSKSKSINDIKRQIRYLQSVLRTKEEELANFSKNFMINSVNEIDFFNCFQVDDLTGN